MQTILTTPNGDRARPVDKPTPTIGKDVGDHGPEPGNPAIILNLKFVA